ncbi:hypothetical protein FYC62_07610 [Pedobacter aquae]|uniref:Uncharacterized protein n=1 Tax=Pedobacter aquae TaxID=2605747 RepID=A0A5C0VKQ4_9SPHI|nr:hypothetical protein [Pedobacter aquae]QEK51544.1 hypothetical protein FYC62_07610 [Pedobacter aquae]
MYWADATERKFFTVKGRTYEMEDHKNGEFSFKLPHTNLDNLHQMQLKAKNIVFLIADEDKKFYPAEARIQGDKVVVFAAEVKHPVAVRYAFHNYSVTNFQNKSNLPAVPFRTDNWNE